MSEDKSILSRFTFDRPAFLWIPTGVSTIVLGVAVFLLFYASSMALTPCGASIAEAQSQCEIGDDETFTGPVTFEDEINAGATPGPGSTGYVLLSQGADTPAEWRRFTEIVKSANETVTSSTTLQNDDAFQIAGAANTTYIWEGVLLFDTGATPDFKFGFLLPAGATVDGISVHDFGSGTNTQYFTEASSVSVTNNSGAANALLIRAIVETAGTSGTVGIQWAQSTSDPSNTTVSANSYMIVKEAS